MTIEATVDDTGFVVEANVTNGGDEMLDALALQAVRQWRYQPGTVDGEPASFILTIHVVFRLLQ